MIEQRVTKPGATSSSSSSSGSNAYCPTEAKALEGEDVDQMIEDYTERKNAQRKTIGHGDDNHIELQSTNHEEQQRERRW